MPKEKSRPPVGEEPGGQQYSTEQIIRAKTTLKSEREWRRLNPELFAAEVEGYALQEMHAARPFSAQTILERIRWKDRVNTEGQPVKVSNDYGAIWARLLREKYREMGQYLKVKPSIFDFIKPSW